MLTLGHPQEHPKIFCVRSISGINAIVKEDSALLSSDLRRKHSGMTSVAENKFHSVFAEKAFSAFRKGFCTGAEIKSEGSFDAFDRTFLFLVPKNSCC